MSPTRGTRTRGGAGSVGSGSHLTPELRGSRSACAAPLARPALARPPSGASPLACLRVRGPHAGNPYYKKRHQTAIAAAATRPRQHRSGGDDTGQGVAAFSYGPPSCCHITPIRARARSLISSCTGILPALARQGQAAVSSSSLSDASKAYYMTLPVFGSMRLPPTRPVVGSVPLGRRKSRMCGSGLQWVARGSGALASWRASLERAVVESRWQVGAGGHMRSGMVGAWERSVGAQRGPRGCSPVDGVVHPPAALLHADAAPLRFSQ